MSADMARTLKDFFVEGVQDGYAAKAAIRGVEVGGKMGPLKSATGPSLGFIGFAPADNPRLAIAVIMEHQGSGSDVAILPRSKCCGRHLR
jgi:peptidoglycan glycosyltransferase